MNGVTASCFVLSLVLILGTSSHSADEISVDPIWPGRRRDQFQKSFGYAIFPYPYSLPGIGLVGGAMNIADTYTDAYGILFAGDVKGTSFGVADIHIIPKTLILEV